MNIVSIDGELLRKMMISGANALHNEREKVDALNVFPVPDGDTGTNMSLTFLAAAKEAEKLQTPTVSDVAKAVSSGSLRGARGNSGVILSQLFRGFSKGLEGLTTANVDDLANAFIKASEMAYKAVMKPKEGTILTIAKAMAERAAEMAFETDDVSLLLSEMVAHGRVVLARTKEMLPALKQADVVDAGGYGLLLIWDAARRSLSAPFSGEPAALAPEWAADAPGGSQGGVFSAVSPDAITFGYCTEFFILLENEDGQPGATGATGATGSKGTAEEQTEALKQFLAAVGDSIVAVADDAIIKIHVHTNNPGTVLEKALTIGTLDRVKIENMRIQHTNKINFERQNGHGAAEPETGDSDSDNKPISFVVVSSGAGFKETFESLGADIVVEGGQTMNPSTEDFIEAIDRIRADCVLLFPNNKNIILAAEQAAALTENKTVIVVPTKSVPQGVSALINYSHQLSAEENARAMAEAIRAVRTGQLTYAVRDTVLADRTIQKDDILGMIDGEIVVVAKEMQDGAQALIDQMLNEDSEVLTIFYGEGVSPAAAEDLLLYTKERFPFVEAEAQEGGQPVYYYVFSAE